jgi:hypothetical protein
MRRIFINLKKRGIFYRIVFNGLSTHHLLDFSPLPSPLPKGMAEPKEESIEISHKEEPDKSQHSPLVESEKDRFCLAFNKRAFGFGNDGMPNALNVNEKANKKSCELTDSEWELIISVLSGWNQPDDIVAQTQFRKKHRQGYRYVQIYFIEFVSIPGSGGEQGKQLRRLTKIENNAKQKGRICLPQSQVFDAIYEAHYGASHMKSGVWTSLKKDYHNISEKLCITFAKLCPVCVNQDSFTSRKRLKTGSI